MSTIGSIYHHACAWSFSCIPESIKKIPERLGLIKFFGYDEPVKSLNSRKFTHSSLKDWNTYAQDIVSAIIENDFCASELEAFLNGLRLDEIKNIGDEIVKRMLQKNLPDLHHRFLKLIPLEKMLKDLEIQDIYKRALPFIAHGQSKNSCNSNVVTNFFPNLGQALLRAFTIFQSQRPPESLYEYGVVVSIYFQFLTLLYYIIQGIGALVSVPSYAFIASAMLVTICAAALYSYLRWFQGCPQEIESCINISKDKEKIPPFYVRDAELQNMLARMGTDQSDTRLNWLIVGPAGAGKSHFMKWLATLLPNKIFFKLRPGCFFDGNLGITADQRINGIFRSVEGYEGQVVFCIDDLGSKLKNPKIKGLEEILRSLNDDNKDIQLMGTMTDAEYKEIICKNDSLDRRFSVIRLEAFTPEKTQFILEMTGKELAPHICFDPSVFIRIVGDKKVNPNESEPARSLKIFKQLINCLKTDIEKNKYARHQQAFVKELHQMAQLIVHKKATDMDCKRFLFAHKMVFEKIQTMMMESSEELKFPISAQYYDSFSTRYLKEKKDQVS